MIRKPTVLIFGAGVSVEYGFPLGRSLLLQIVATLRRESLLRSLLKACGFTYSVIEQFRQELDLSGQPSVDAFLEQQKETPELVRLGKTAIAASLIPCEGDAALTNRDALRLYEYLWHQISGAANSYSRNQLSILTFNYDRSFERYLRTVLRASHPEFRGGGAPFTATLSQFDVIHLYGTLGDLDPGSEAHLPYGGSVQPFNLREIIASAERIKLYHEAKFDDDTLERIQLRIAEAETICFLGFGFHPINVRILEFCGLGKNKTTTHFASAYGLKDGEKASIRKMLGFDIQFAHEGATSLEALRALPVLASS